MLRHPAARRRVLYVSPQPFFEQRGTPLRVRQMLRSLRAGGHEVDLASYHLGAPADVPGLRHVRAWRVPGIDAVKVGFSWQKIVLDASLALRVWALMLTRRYDVVHCVEESVFFVLPLARALRIPVVFDLNSSVAHALEYGGAVRSQRLLAAARAIQAAALRRSALAVTTGSALTEEGVRGLGVAIPVAEVEDCPIDDGSAPDAGLVERLRRDHVPGGARVVVYTGNLASYQGIDLLFEALPWLVARCPAAHLLVVGGDAADIARARAGLAERALDAFVTFAGQQPAERMSAFMALGDALVSPRRGGRNTPLKLYSYMHSGVPIVATDLPTHTQVLDDSCAVLCPATPDGLGAALASVLDAPERFAPVAEAARRRVAERYSADAFAGKLLAAYDAIGAATDSTTATNMYPRVQGTSASSAANARIGA